MIGISSSGIRDRVSRGLPIDYLVPGEVERYVIAHGLYRGSSD
jgi:nicotinic acid mononucleotide adenylyltransferase